MFLLSYKQLKHLKNKYKLLITIHLYNVNFQIIDIPFLKNLLLYWIVVTTVLISIYLLSDTLNSIVICLRVVHEK